MTESTIDSAITDANLTEFEFLALNSQFNLSDGHARQELTPGQAEVVENLPGLWREAVCRRVEDVEAEAHEAYFTLLGQHSYPRDGVLSCYSSSVAMEIFARSLATTARKIALIHPTFDNIPDILRGVGLELVAVEEDQLHHNRLDVRVLREVSSLFVTTPNNPTGAVLSEARLRELAAQCREHDVVLTLDTSFRGFAPAAQYDHYAVLRDSGCRWVVIEDTGKLWPTLELKIGFLVSPPHVGLPIQKIYSDILLGISPLVMLMVRQFARDARAGGLTALHEFIAENRAMLRAGLADVPDVRIMDPTSVASVERLHLGWRTATDVWEALRKHNVYALPCGPFHWNNPAEGDHSLRIALSRRPTAVAAAVEALRAVLIE